MSAKVLLPVLIFAVVVLIGFRLTSWNAPPKPPPVFAAVTEFAGVKLEASPSDVILALGAPDGITEPSIDSGLTRFDFVYSRLDLEIIFYGENKNSAKAAIICTSQPQIPLLGFNNGDSEGLVIQKLGNPDTVSVSRDHLSKIDSFKKWKAAFVFKQGALTQKCAPQSGSMIFNEKLLKPGAPKNGASKSSRSVMPAATASAQETLGTAPVENSTTPDAAVTAAPRDTGDGSKICAPNLSKEERLDRLAAFGTVRQSGEETYEAGSHRVQFVLGGLVDCY